MDWVSKEFGLVATVGALTGVNQEYLDAGDGLCLHRWRATDLNLV